MGRNYSQPTIKALFAEARSCAYPGCDAPLIFRDRGAVTAVADIAHIRSESPGGPRYDQFFGGDLNGPENLLLLCGQHHRPVDRHESLYSIEELLSWKADQAAAAAGGTTISEADVRAYARLSAEERGALAEVARLAKRLSSRCSKAQQDIDYVRREREQARLDAARRIGPVWEVDEDGNRSPEPISADRYRLPRVDQDRWDEAARATVTSNADSVQEAVAPLEEEVAVLRMFSAGLAPWLEHLDRTAEQLVRSVGDADAVSAANRALDAAVSAVWTAANGETEPPSG